MSHVLLTHQRPEMNMRVASSGFRLNLSPTVSLILMMTLIALMGILSLTRLNAMSTKGYVIKKLEDDYQELVSDNELNDMLILQARSLTSIKESDQVQAMVMPSNVYFVDSVTGLALLDTP